MKTDFLPTEQMLHDDAAAATMPPGWISQTLRQLERWVGWSIALYTAWLALFVHPGMPALWFFVLYAGLVGKWAEAVPARTQGAMVTRALALVAGAYALHLFAADAAGGGVEQFFFWLAITSLAYAFMLRPAAAAIVVAAALVELVAVSLQTGSADSIAALLPQAGYLCIFPLLLGVRFGAEMRRPDETLESGRIDAATSLYNKAGLMAYGNELLAECKAVGRPLSVAVFDCSDLHEVRSVYGTRTARKLTDCIVEKLVQLAGERGLAARTGHAEFTVLLPGLAHERATAAIERVLGKPSRIEFDAGDSEIVLVPGVAVETSGPDIDSVDELYRELRLTLEAWEQDEERRQHHLQRERERHSRPMGITPLAERHPVGRRVARIQISPTLPASLSAG